MNVLLLKKEATKNISLTVPPPLRVAIYTTVLVNIVKIGSSAH